MFVDPIEQIHNGSKPKPPDPPVRNVEGRPRKLATFVWAHLRSMFLGGKEAWACWRRHNGHVREGIRGAK